MPPQKNRPNRLGLTRPEDSGARSLPGMELRRFRRSLLRMPSQLLRQGGRQIFRQLSPVLAFLGTRLAASIDDFRTRRRGRRQYNSDACALSEINLGR